MTATLELESDALAEAEKLARKQGKPLGRVVSDLLRTAMTPLLEAERAELQRLYETTGFHPFPRRNDLVVTDELVNAIRDEEGI